MHPAPVVGILVLDGLQRAFPSPGSGPRSVKEPPDMQGSHQLLVVSEGSSVPYGRRQGPQGSLHNGQLLGLL